LKPNVLFVTEKWPSNNPEFGLTNSYHNLFDTLALTGFAEEHRVLHFDDWFLQNGEKADSELLTIVAEHKVDIVIYTWLVGKLGPSDPIGPFNPDILTFHRMKRINPKLRTCTIWWDSTWETSQHMIQLLYPYVNLSLTMDYTFKDSPESLMAMWTPQNPELYYGDPVSERPIDVAHAGSLDNRPERVKAFAELQRRGIVVSHSGGQREDKLSAQDYAGYMRNCKIMLDFTPYHHKGRAWETTLSGTMLMAAKTSQLNRWFIPDVDYVAYEMNGEEPNYDDLTKKIKDYLRYPKKRLEIAANGWKRATEEYNYKKWWSKVLGKLEWQPNEEQAVEK